MSNCNLKEKIAEHKRLSSLYIKTERDLFFETKLSKGALTYKYKRTDNSFIEVTHDGKIIPAIKEIK